MIGIVDHGMGNLLSVFNAFEYMGADVELCGDPRDLEDADKIVLPGVGAFPDCMKNLKELGFQEVLNRLVLEEKRPVLGICLGMQVMAEWGEEFGEHQGLGWIPGRVVRIRPEDPGLKVPHVGWNNIRYSSDSPLLKGLPESPDFYFVHSFHMECTDPAHVDAWCDYGGRVTAAVRRDNIFATQFHPEKSQDFGLKIIENFLSWH
ncbi:imidazole glycerol phosphate synthase, glutamine amidotransferase subunit [Desulfatibacillum aliphaticivorans]|uniref:Imidazole glycerol phosphate synthase subunit HisH n=1 Tax=Desulfatibacillum aliphaticivorans TaxID=218208 RepID=B8FJR1_DESAL|nr:imidazole glycerol phosphate synthase subunit HisH [Desulfatibacillum aliphaticivorans]ACL02339.1 imidazole glycerol phosphate synthase, glutamine amidotransferase subunit [Desulfatibacillum aliphaticivorans]